MAAFDAEEERAIKEFVEDLLSSIKVQQHNLPKNIIKSRHVGEGVRFIRSGNSSNLPSEGERDGAIYFENDTNKLKVWDEGNSTWRETTLT